MTTQTRTPRGIVTLMGMTKARRARYETGLRLLIESGVATTSDDAFERLYEIVVGIDAFASGKLIYDGYFLPEWWDRLACLKAPGGSRRIIEASQALAEHITAKGGAGFQVEALH